VSAPDDSRRQVPVLKKDQYAGIELVNIDNKLGTTLMSKQQMKPVPLISLSNFQSVKPRRQWKQG